MEMPKPATKNTVNTQTCVKVPLLVWGRLMYTLGVQMGVLEMLKLTGETLPLGDCCAALDKLIAELLALNK